MGAGVAHATKGKRKGSPDLSEDPLRDSLGGALGWLLLGRLLRRLGGGFRFDIEIRRGEEIICCAFCHRILIHEEQLGTPPRP